MFPALCQVRLTMPRNNAPELSSQQTTLKLPDREGPGEGHHEVLRLMIPWTKEESSAWLGLAWSKRMAWLRNAKKIYVRSQSHWLGSLEMRERNSVWKRCQGDVGSGYRWVIRPGRSEQQLLSKLTQKLEVFPPFEHHGCVFAYFRQPDQQV